MDGMTTQHMGRTIRRAVRSANCNLLNYTEGKLQGRRWRKSLGLLVLLAPLTVLRFGLEEEVLGTMFSDKGRS